MDRHSGAGRKRGKGRRGFAQAARAASHLLDRASVKRGFAERKLIAEWPRIVGPDLAAACRPLRMSFRRGDGALGATLVVEAEGARAVEAQHLADRIVERVNQVYGYGAVARLKVVQTGEARRGAERRASGHAFAAAAVILDPSPTISGVEDDGLRGALALLEVNVKRRSGA